MIAVVQHRAISQAAPAILMQGVGKATGETGLGRRRSIHSGHFRKRMLIERHGPTWKLTPLGLLGHAQGRADSV
jgi:hypothetical protein